MRYSRDGFSVEAAFKKNRPLPDDHWYYDQPPIVPGSDWFYEAYRDLATCRPPDGPIAWLDAMAYADRKRIAPDVADVLWEVVHRMDDTERQWRLDELNAGGMGARISDRRED